MPNDVPNFEVANLPLSGGRTRWAPRIALALIHPLGGDLRAWDAVRAIWGDRHPLVAFDLAGAGCSALPATPPTPAERVAELETLRGLLGLEALIPVGVAIGAMIAALYAAAHPARTPAAILCNPAIALSDASRKVTQDRLAKLRRGGMEALTPEVVDLAFTAMPRDDGYAAYLTRFRRQDPAGYEMSALAGLQINLAEVLPRIACPVLVPFGECDVLFPPAEARRVADRIPGARLHPLPRAAHFPPIQDPAGFAAAVDAFLASLSPNPAAP